MVDAADHVKHWKDVTSFQGAFNLVERGALLSWKEVRGVRKHFTNEEAKDLSTHFGQVFCANLEDRAFCELVVESYLVWLANLLDHDNMNAFLQVLVKDEKREQACKLFIEVALAGDVTDSEHGLEIYSTGICTICEMGIMIEESASQNRESAEPLLDFIATYLLSIANSNNSGIRMSLLHYFGYMSVRSPKVEKAFNRIMNRFGHTVLDHLFLLLFNRKSEGVALQYLTENLPYILGADNHCQRILHETLKYYMLKNPERFILFMQIFSDHLLNSEHAFTPNKQVFIQHLGALFRVTSEVGHRELAKDISLILQQFVNKGLALDLIERLLSEPELKVRFKAILKLIQLGQSGSGKDNLKLFRSSKRGRKPTFGKTEVMSVIGQISYLSAIEVA